MIDREPTAKTPEVLRKSSWNRAILVSDGLRRRTVNPADGRADDDQAPGLTSNLSFTATPGFALFANAIAFFLAA